MKAIIIIFVVMFAGCNTIPKIVDPVPQDAGGIEDCQPACENLAKLECPGWKGAPGVDEIFDTDDDVPCVDVCINVVSETTGTLFPRCTAQAMSCEEVDECFD